MSDVRLTPPNVRAYADGNHEVRKPTEGRPGSYVVGKLESGRASVEALNHVSRGVLFDIATQRSPADIAHPDETRLFFLHLARIASDLATGARTLSRNTHVHGPRPGRAAYIDARGRCYSWAHLRWLSGFLDD